MNHSTAGLPVYHQLPEFTQTHVHCWGKDKAQIERCIVFIGQGMVRISLLQKLMYRIKAIPIKILEDLKKIDKLILKSIWNTKDLE